jgi:hypothetical protein
MKNYLFFLIFLLNSFFTQAQIGLLPKWEIRFGGGMASYDKKIKGAQAFADFAIPLSGYFAVVPGITGNLALKKDDKSYYSYYSLGTTLSARLIPFPKSFDRLKIDIGGFYQYFIHSDASFSSPPILNYSPTIFGYFSKWDLYGMYLSLSGSIIHKEHFKLGIKADRFLPFGQDKSEFLNWQAGFFIGARF